MSYTSGYVPGQGAEEQFQKDIVHLALGQDPPSAQYIAIRQLFTEAYTHTMESLRLCVERREGDPPRKLPAKDRVNKLRMFEQRLPGVNTRPEWEPSSVLVDLILQHKSDGNL
eukprot:1410857-Amphidinium_carterae.1